MNSQTHNLNNPYHNNQIMPNNYMNNCASSPCEVDMMPCDTILRIDSHETMMTSYMEMHDIEFELPERDFGSQEQRNAYNITKQLKKYFAKRRFYFSLFQEGIQLDCESWYSVIAQPISLYLIQRLKYVGVKTVFEPFSGVGGFAVHAAGQFQTFIANDIDSNKIKMLKNNIAVYGKGLNLLKINNADYINIKPAPVDAVFICPPWGGIDYSQYSWRDLDQIMIPKLSDILTHCKKFSKNMIIQMPKNTNVKNLIKVINMCFLTPIIKIQKIIIQQRLSQLFVFIGDLKFTQVNPEVLNIIIKESRGSNLTNANMKQLKKDLKNKLKIQKFNIFNEIFANSNIVNQKKHIFFE